VYSVLETQTAKRLEDDALASSCCRCRDHGVWLDAGELRQLLEWARAGGALLDQQQRQQEQEQELRAVRRAAAVAELQGDAPEAMELLGPLGRSLARWLS
jgi:Zn-finger nucleic acid-binding protein